MNQAEVQAFLKSNMCSDIPQFIRAYTMDGKIYETATGFTDKFIEDAFTEQVQAVFDTIFQAPLRAAGSRLERIELRDGNGRIVRG